MTTTTENWFTQHWWDISVMLLMLAAPKQPGLIVWYFQHILRLSLFLNVHLQKAFTTVLMQLL